MKHVSHFSVGRGGYISGALWLNHMFKTEVVKLQDLYKICDSIVRSGQEYSVRKSNSRQRLPPLMYSYYDTEYLGGVGQIFRLFVEFFTKFEIMFFSCPWCLCHFANVDLSTRLY